MKNRTSLSLLTLIYNCCWSYTALEGWKIVEDGSANDELINKNAVFTRNYGRGNLAIEEYSIRPNYVIIKIGGIFIHLMESAFGVFRNFISSFAESGLLIGFLYQPTLHRWVRRFSSNILHIGYSYCAFWFSRRGKVLGDSILCFTKVGQAVWKENSLILFQENIWSKQSFGTARFSDNRPGLDENYPANCPPPSCRRQ